MAWFRDRLAWDERGGGMIGDVVRPPRLAPGDVVAVLSPSAGLAGRYPRRLARGVKALERLGFTVEVMPFATRDDSWVGGTVEQRLSDLHAAFADERVRGIVATIGGNHTAQLLGSVDYDLIRANPKVFCGYSDITSLLHAMLRETGLVGFYGPAVLAQFGEWPEPYPETIAHFVATTSVAAPVGPVPHFDTFVGEFIDWAEDEVRPRRREPAAARRVIRGGAGRGRLVAGCVPTIRHLVGTPWQLDFRESVLVLDIPDMGYGVRDLDADLWHLRNAGILADLAGLVLSRPRHLDAGQTDQLCVVAEAAVRPYAYPVIAQLACGHGDPVATLPIGLRATLDGTDLTIEEPAVH